jgi:hypothetical protein
MSHLRNGIRASQLRGVTWRKSSRSGPTGGNCVEMAALSSPKAVAVRDSRQADGPALIFTAATWRAFTGGLAVGWTGDRPGGRTGKLWRVPLPLSGTRHFPP